jgi:hypothetical protein
MKKRKITKEAWDAHTGRFVARQKQQQEQNQKKVKEWARKKFVRLTKESEARKTENAGK